MYNYKPEIYTNDVLLPDLASYYQSLFGITRWMVELGRVDIAVEVSKLSSHNALPQEGHFECLLHVMAYLRDRHNSRMAFDPSYPGIKESAFNQKANGPSFIMVPRRQYLPTHHLHEKNLLTCVS